MSEKFEEGQFSDAEEENEVSYIQNKIRETSFGMYSHVQLETKVANLHITCNEEAIEDSDNDEYYCNNDYDLYEDKNAVIKTSSQRFNTQEAPTKVTNYQPKHKLLTRYANKINLEKYAGPSLPDHVANVLIENDKRVDKDRIRMKDKSDHATTENVLDSRIKKKLHKLFERGILAEINGCISTGKEANVYYAKSKNQDEIAIKIYRTSILTFKNREKYIRGEYRFDHVYSLHNPRKMVKIWAEKEFSNLKRLEQGGVRAPQPLLYGGHMLLMEFLGSDGWAAPKLKDAVLTDSKSRMLYRECIEIMWKMYNKCRLVHADLIDRDHCNAIEFLRNDCSNITAFFKKHNVGVMSLQALFDFITDPTINEKNMDEYLDIRMQEANKENDPQQQIEEAVFKQAYIPQRLTQVVNVERDINLAKSGKDLIYKTLIGLKADLSKPAEAPEILVDKHRKDKNIEKESDTCSSSEDSDNSDSENDSESEDNKSKFINSARPRNESPDSKKARKKAVKEQQAEKRKTKVKKHVKKRKLKVSRGGK
ncbi:serine/threonine-protein kinase rio1 isoform X2 [Cataglyphis hispanica]|uniref:serine/threonine-protein kinase rio1 isoform X2 n=1 Tax=Cataglyphis hispanica TaxID=1086592 RepID=UPI0021805E0E|nr:serine/threonine-protein kinase rio1 isoform X2 [Cataglyphis hispanica]